MNYLPHFRYALLQLLAVCKTEANLDRRDVRTVLLTANLQQTFASKTKVNLQNGH